VSLIHRPLAGMIVNLSISESDDSVDRGFPLTQVNRVTLQVVSALFGQGASLIFGHDWREDGVMEAVHGFAQQVQIPVALSPKQSKEIVQPLLWNLVPWPDTPWLLQSDLECLVSTLRVESAGLPEELTKYEKEARDKRETPLYQYLRARGLTHLRHRLTEISRARLCLGGRKSGSEGRYPGIIEEALFSLEKRKPLYLVGVLGGATYQLVQALRGESMPDDFCLPTKAHPYYTDPPIPGQISKTKTDGIVAPKVLWEEFRNYGIDGLAKNNRLTNEENLRLFETTVLDEIIQTVLIGFSRVKLAQVQ
jgi:hypothetical protein